MTEPKRKRGRPPGPPNPPKEPKKMGRPTIWDEPPIKVGISAPPQFFELFKNPEFKKKIKELMLDFQRKNKHQIIRRV